MAASIPQLQKDLGAATKLIGDQRLRIAELENQPRRIVEIPVDRVVNRVVEVPIEVIVTKRDNSEIERLGKVLIERERENAKLRAALVSVDNNQVAKLEREIIKLKSLKPIAPVEVIKRIHDTVEVEKLNAVVASRDAEIARLKVHLLAKPTIVYQNVSVE